MQEVGMRELDINQKTNHVFIIFNRGGVIPVFPKGAFTLFSLQTTIASNYVGLWKILIRNFVCDNDGLYTRYGRV